MEYGPFERGETPVVEKWKSLALRYEDLEE